MGIKPKFGVGMAQSPASTMAARFIAFATVVAVAKAGIIGAPLASPLLAPQLAAPGLIGGVGVASPLLARSAISPYGLGAPAISQLGVASPLLARSAISHYGLGAPGISQLGVASPLLARSAISPYGLGAPAISQLGVASPLLARSAISPYGLASPAISSLGLGVASPLVARSAISPVGISSLGLAPRLASPLVAKTIVPQAVDTDYDPNPSYSYAYDVQDALTGDSKNQQESRQGDVVQGSYSLNDPDGTRRTVEYTADPVNGFNAVVHRQPLAVAKTVVAAPAIARLAAPLGLAQTIIH